jgi:RNA polymerase sigma factor (sigma-70 family)
VIVGGGGATYGQTQFVVLSEVVMTGDVARADVVTTTTVDPYADRDDAVDALFRRHCAGLVRLAFCLLGERGAAEEVVQDAFLALHRQWWRLRAHTSAVPYLRAAVVNGCRSRQRRMVRARALATALRPLRTSVTSSEESAMMNDEQARLAAAVWMLPPRQREVLVCRFYLEMSASQTADLLQIGAASVSTHTQRGLASLARQMGVTK